MLAVVALALVAIVARHADPDLVVRTIPLGPHLTGIAVDERTGRAFVGASDASGMTGRVDMFDTVTGAAVHAVALIAGPAGMVVDERRDHIFVAGSTNGAEGITMLDARDGRAVRTIVVSSYPTGLAVDERRGRLFVATPDLDSCPRYALSMPCSKVDVYDTADGHLLRMFIVHASVMALAVDEWADRLIVVGDVARVGVMSVLDATSGRLIGRMHTVAQVGYLPGRALAVDERDGRAFVLGGNAPAYSAGNLYVVDTHTGALLHSYATASLPTDVTVDAGAGRAFVALLGPVRRGSANNGSIVPIGHGSVAMLDARAGRIVRTVATGVASFAVTVDPRDRRVLVANVGTLDYSGSGALDGAGSVTILDERTGEVLRTAPAGVFPAQVAIDARRGRAFVVNVGGTVRVRDPWAWLPPWLRRALPFIPRVPRPTRDASASVTVLDTTR